ncbi:hypothetical protein Tco_0454988 [Tanacetum coccineum]
MDSNLQEIMKRSSTVNVVGIEVNDVGAKTSIELPNDLNMPELEDIVYSADDEDVGVEADMNNLDTFMHVSPIPTTRIHKDHPAEQINGDMNSAPQTRRMIKNLEEHGLFSLVQQRTNHKGFQNWLNFLLFCFLSQENPKRLMAQNGVFKNKKDDRGIVIKKQSKMDVKSAFPLCKSEEEFLFCHHQDLKIQTFLTEYTKYKRHFMDCIKLTRAWIKGMDSSLQQRLSISWRVRLIFMECKKQTVVAIIPHRTEYASCFNFCANILYEKEANSNGFKIHTDKNVADLLIKSENSQWGTAVTSPIGMVKQIIITEATIGKSIFSSEEASLGDQEDVSKQGRKIYDIDADEDIPLENVHDADMFGVNELDSDEVVVESEVTDKAGEKRNIVEEVVAVTDAITILVKGQGLKDKGKAKMIELEKPLKKKDQIKFDEEEALRLQAKFQAQEQQELTIEEKSTLFVQLLEKRKKHFAAKEQKKEK